MVAGSWLHILRQPSGFLLSCFFSVATDGKLLCKPAIFPRPPPRVVGPFLSSKKDTRSLAVSSCINISRSSRDWVQTYRWRDVGIEHLIRMPGK